MSRLGTVTRRGLMIGAAAVAGGVAFGSYKVLVPHANPLAEGLGSDAASFNPFIRITPDGVTLILQHVDLGQGAASLQAAP